MMKERVKVFERQKNKDLRTLKSTLVYCEDVQSALNRFGKDYEVFAHDRVFFMLSACR